MHAEVSARTGLPREVYIIIGNGFDKEAGLKTSYPEFLDFINAVNLHFQNIISYNNKPKELLEEYKRIRKEAGKTIDLSKWEKMPKNFWYQHFKKVSYIQQGWIDFENEISNMIYLVEEEVKKANTIDELIVYDPQSHFYSEIYQPLKNLNKLDQYMKKGGVTFREFRDQLLVELNELIDAFDFYLQEFVEINEEKPTEAIMHLFGKLGGYQYCRVLSFNYTNTFKRMITKMHPELHVDYCHVHGKVGDNGGKGNLVLGIDEKYQSEGEISILLAPFKKYYQRVYKRTDSNYADWLHDIEANRNNQRELYIFGHSIGMTDKDILKAFITSDNMRTVVYSYNDKARADQIANMTGIIGIDEMVKQNAGSDRMLEFELQG